MSDPIPYSLVELVQSDNILFAGIRLQKSSLTGPLLSILLLNPEGRPLSPSRPTTVLQVLRSEATPVVEY